MQNLKNLAGKLKKSHLQVAGVLILITLSLILLWFGNATSMQSLPPLMAQVEFRGEYRIGDGQWQPIVKGEHISSTKGDVTLRGNFHMLDPFGGYVGVYKVYSVDDPAVALYTDHINLAIYDGGDEPFVMDTENPIYGSTGCGKVWNAFRPSADNEGQIEIVIHNPHSFGNENAIDQMLSQVAMWSGIEFEKEIMDSGSAQRGISLLFVIVAIMLLGIALFSSLIHLKRANVVWIFGLVALFAGGYFAYSSEGVFFWSDSVVTNTTILGISMMLYMTFLLVGEVYLLKKTALIGNIATAVNGVTTAAFIILPTFTDLLFYDLWPLWTVVQTAVNAVICYCFVRELISAKGRERLLYLIGILPLVAFVIDVVGVYLGAWVGGVISRYVFFALFAVATVMALKLIPSSINAANKARALEMEKTALNAQLTESRVSTMMSQIRPHFIYNTLGSIEQLCKLDPQKAGELVHNFAKYLRGNFGELDNPKPILMSQEMAHVKHYISIENVRFPDMTFSFRMDSEDFYIPALTVQPIVENAIKHGLMKLPKGGTIRVVCYESDTDYCITVEDDGVGFDTGTLSDERRHVGLRNIRERLKVMVGGALHIESESGVGTKVLITIPKEKMK